MNLLRPQKWKPRHFIFGASDILAKGISQPVNVIVSRHGTAICRKAYIAYLTPIRRFADTVTPRSLTESSNPSSSETSDSEADVTCGVTSNHNDTWEAIQSAAPSSGHETNTAKPSTRLNVLSSLYSADCGPGTSVGVTNGGGTADAQSAAATPKTITAAASIIAILRAALNLICSSCFIL